MKKILGLLILMMVVLSSSNVTAALRKTKTLYDFLEKIETCKVYLNEFANTSGESGAGAEILNKTMAKALGARITQNFTVVNNPSEADIIISAEIIQFMYTDEDPAYDGIVGVGMTPINPVGLAVDMAMKQSYVENRVSYLVTDKNGGKLWSRKIYSTVTKGDMPLEEAVNIIAERSVKNFFIKCLKKPRR
ncbi:MAG: hypothetical protein KAQ99_06230 [Candidatus Aureabacteria bacterium]|nr:hypothetical protein [Candidatus Auribacterota bacterium]MCK5655967.1 hypothetical protein [Candidatus Auribacterota bacterium]